jgi:glycine oxidase
MPHIDALVVGHGIAGALLADALLAEGWEVAVCDLERPGTSSRVAAGLVHPMVPKTGGLTWKADDIFSGIRSFYDRIESRYGCQFYFPMTMAYLCGNAQAEKHWHKAADKVGSNWLTWAEMLPEWQGAVAQTHQSGRLDMPGLINTLAEARKKEGRFIGTEFNWSDVQQEQGIWNWRDFQCRRIILCQGQSAARTGPFNWLPFELTKGELLTLDGRGLMPALRGIRKLKAFVMPVSEGIYKVGSTYTRDFADELPSASGRAQLLEWARAVHPSLADANVLEHVAGIRPTVGGRRPFLGEHPGYPGVFICNGWGSKGGSLATILIPALVQYLQSGEGLIPETDISRFSFTA